MIKKFYYQPSIIVYRLTYNGNNNTGGVAPIDSNSYTTGQSVTTLGNTGNLVNTNYTFVGWNTLPNGNGINFQSGDTFTIFGNMTLYAKWLDNIIQINYCNWDVSGDWDEQIDISTDIPYSLLTPPSVLGYTFSGWYTDRTYQTSISTITLRYLGDNIRYSDIYVYAKWIPKTYTIIFDDLGGSGGMGTITNVSYEFTVHDLESNYPIISTPTKHGYEFYGYFKHYTSPSTWNMNVIGGDSDNEWQLDVDQFIESGDGDTITLYAKWVSKYYYLTYDDNGSTGGAVPPPQSYIYNSTTIVSGNDYNLTKTGYTFVCWNTAADGSGTDYFSGDIITIDNDITLYAKWQAV